MSESTHASADLCHGRLNFHVSISDGSTAGLFAIAVLTDNVYRARHGVLRRRTERYGAARRRFHAAVRTHCVSLRDCGAATHRAVPCRVRVKETLP